MHRPKRGRPFKDRISKFLHESVDPDTMRDAGGRMKTFIHDKPILSACIGVAAGFVLGLMFRRGD